jgi:hypothetical protein
MNFVENVKDAWKWFSIQLIGFAFIWEMLPDETKDAVTPDLIEPYVTAALLIAAAYGRLVKQGATK